MERDRSELRFREEAQKALSFLVEDHGFSFVSASDHLVRYESKKVYIEMVHGFRDYEVYIDFGLIDMQKDYSFSLFLESVNPALDKSLGDRMVKTPETVAATVAAVAKALQSEGQGIIRGDDEVFERMKGIHFWTFHPEYLG